MQPRTLPQTATFALCLIAAASLAMAQRNRDQQEYPVQTFAVTEIEGEFGMEYNYFGETIRRDGSGRTRYSNHYYQEYLMGMIRGYAYHPRFIDYSGSLKLGLAQQSLSYKSPFEDSRSSTDHRALLGYSLRLDILKDNAVSGTVTASRDERILMGLFLDRYRVITDSYSGTIRWRRDNLRMDLTGTHTDTEEFGFRSKGTTASDMLLYNLRHDVGRRMRTDLRYRLHAYERDFTARTPLGDVRRETESVSHDLNLTNRLSFDNEDRLTLRSTFRFHDRDGREGIQDLRTYYLEEMLRYNASRLMRPYLRASVRRNEYEESSVDTYRGEAGFDGDLYESLSYHFDIHAMRTNHDAFTEDRYGPTARLNYRKQTALGLLSGSYSRSLEHVERSGMAGTLEIRNELVVLNAAFPSFLRRGNVIPASIRVTDTSNLIVFQEGFDYDVVIRGDRVGIRLRPGGTIADGTAVRVDYRVEITARESYLADDEGISLRHDFTRVVKGLSLYGRRHTFRARNVSSHQDLDVVEYTSDTVGLRQEWRDFAFNSEYEMYDDDLGGYDRWLNQLEGNHDLGRRIRWGWNAGVVETRYDTDFGRDRDDRNRHLFAGTHVNGTFARSGFWRIEGNIMKDTGRTERTTKGIIGRIGYEWRRLTLESGVRLEQYDVPDSEHDRVQVFLGMKLHLGRRSFARRSP